jgi:hypothetical protein
MRKGICALLSAIVFVAGCGTTHQFFPPAPLEKKQWQLTLNWHFDVGRPALTTLEPELSAWYGMDQFTNLGFGAQFPCFLSQVSAAHYSRSGSPDRWMTYVTLNQPFGLNNNPYLEAGLSYNLIHPGYWQMHRFGISYGHGLPVIGGLFNLSEAYQTRAYGQAEILSKRRFIPVIGYAIGGREVAFSYVHYHGAAKSSSLNLRDFLQHHNDTLVRITSAEVDSTEFNIRIPDCPWGPTPFWSFHLNSGDTIVLMPPVPHFMCGGVGPIPLGLVDDERDRRIYGGKTDWEKVIVYDSRTQSRREIVGNIPSIIERWTNSGVLLITRYDPRMLERLVHVSDWSSDHSFGFGQISHIQVQRH